MKVFTFEIKDIEDFKKINKIESNEFHAGIIQDYLEKLNLSPQRHLGGVNMFGTKENGYVIICSFNDDINEDKLKKIFGKNIEEQTYDEKDGQKKYKLSEKFDIDIWLE